MKLHNRSLTLLALTLLMGLVLITLSVYASSSSTASPAAETVLFSFEDGVQGWQAAGWAGDAPGSITQTLEHATDGLASLRLDFDRNNEYKTAYYVELGELDWSTAKFLRFDLWKQGQPTRIAIAVQTGDSWTWQQSAEKELVDGANVVQFDLTAVADWSSPLSELNQVRRLVIMLLPTENGAGSAYLDYVRLTDGCEILSSFETGAEGWGLGGFSDSSATGVVPVQLHATDGITAARLDYGPGKYKATYVMTYSAPVDLSDRRCIRFDLWKEGDGVPKNAAAVILTEPESGTDWDYHQAQIAPLQAGANTLEFDLTREYWESVHTGWGGNANGPIHAITEVHAIGLALIIESPIEGGSVYLDNVRFCDTPLTQPAPTPGPTLPPDLPPLPAPPAPPPPAPRSAFVGTAGTQFAVDGHTFRYAGTNTYYMMYKSDYAIDHVYDAMEEMGLRVLRSWAFLDYGSLKDGSVTVRSVHVPHESYYYQYWDLDTNSIQYNDAALRQLDYAVDQAGQRGLKLIMVLTNNWADFGGMDQYVLWHGGEYHDEFYTDPAIKQTYKNWASHLLNHVNSYNGLAYKDDPAIMAWELANEPRCKGSGPARGLPATITCTPATITAWIDEMSAYVKSIDPKHLVDAGDEGFFDRDSTPYYANDWFYNGGENISFDALVALPAIDFGSFHLYPDGWGKTPEWGTRWITEHVAAANAVNKPVIMGEFGLKDPAAKQTWYPTWLEAFHTTGGAGSNYWMIADMEEIWENLFFFEDGVAGWQGSGYSDSGDVGVTHTLTHATNGVGALRLDYNVVSPTQKATYIVDNSSGWDYSGHVSVTLDIWMEQAGQVAIAMCTGNNWVWHESLAQDVVTGANSLEFSMTDPTWKTDDTGWVNSIPVTNTDAVRRLVVLVFPQNDGQGSAYLDNVRLFSRRLYPDYDGFTVYADGPAAPIITAHGTQMDANQTPLADFFSKKVEPQPSAALGGVVTYTLTFTNPNPAAISSMVITDQLPAQVSHPGMVEGTAFLPSGVLQWGPFAVAANDVVRLVFTATVSSDPASNGVTVLNTAYYTASGFTFGGSAQASFIAGTPSYKLFLPLIMKNN
ncbi:MAG: cellulase family glycosylhydrolase [Thermoflexales bacterium]|nr:cellulase family glycosylhydrolase [Thermoflexales bacterium]